MLIVMVVQHFHELGDLLLGFEVGIHRSLGDLGQFGRDHRDVGRGEGGLHDTKGGGIAGDFEVIACSLNVFGTGFESHFHQLVFGGFTGFDEDDAFAIEELGNGNGSTDLSTTCLVAIMMYRQSLLKTLLGVGNAFGALEVCPVTVTCHDSTVP